MRPLLLFLVACGGAAVESGGPSVAPNGTSSSLTSVASGAIPTTAKPRTGPLSLADARAYMVELINRDRATQKLPPVALDSGHATTSGQRHADDMAHLGYLGHWGTDGSVPEQRFTEASGVDMVMENASCMTDLKVRDLDHAPMIDSKTVEDTESMFFNEPPGHDGHRQNILNPRHTHVGIGIAQPKPTATELPTACFSQEFTDVYGTYAAIPAHVKLGSTLHVEGTLSPSMVPGGVGFARIDAPQPIAPKQANAMRSYHLPDAYQNYWPKGFDTPIPITVAGQSFKADLPIGDHGKPGLYEVIVWAKPAGKSDGKTEEEFMRVSVRTIFVD